MTNNTVDEYRVTPRQLAESSIKFTSTVITFVGIVNNVNKHSQKQWESINVELVKSSVAFLISYFYFFLSK